MKRLNKKLKLLEKALLAAKEHLEFCSYGDSYERGLAREDKLEQKINKALEFKIE